MDELNELASELGIALESIDRPRSEAIFARATASHNPIEVAERLIVPALEQLGQHWIEGRIALSQIYLGSLICEQMVERVLPAMAPERKRQPRQAIVVLNDYHMLGKRIVLSVMRASGFDVIDYGRMEVEPLVERILADELSILLISVLMLPSALKVKSLRQLLDARGSRVRIAVGGAPFLFDPDLWREVGADAMGRNAADAVAIVSQWMERTP